MHPAIARRDHASSHVRTFTVVAMATGAVPVPGASIAIVAESAAMVNAVASAYGVSISVGTVVAALGPAAAVNAIGRAVFVEGARLLGWAAGPFGIGAVSALGAATAGLQTWTLGQLAIALSENGGIPLAVDQAQHVIAGARETFDSFRREPETAEAVEQRRRKSN